MTIRPLLALLPFVVTLAAPAPTPKIAPTALKSADPDMRYQSALRNHGTAPDFILITVTDAPGKLGREVCITAPALIDALAKEHGVDHLKAGKIALATPERTFRFTKPDARRQVDPGYTEDELKAARAAIQKVPLEKLRAPGFLEQEYPPFAARDFSDPALAHALMEKGFACRLAGCPAGRLTAHYPEPREERQSRERLREQRGESENATQRLARAIPGWSKTSATHALESAQLGGVNGEPEALVTALTPVPPALVDAVTWWNPIEKDTPRHTWHDFLAYDAKIQKRLAAHRWLSAGKSAAPGLTLDLRLYGVGVAHQSAALRDASALWAKAGCRGTPLAVAFARRENRCVELILGDEDPRLLAVHTTAPHPAPQVELDKLILTGKPGAEYALIAPDGTITVR